MIGSVNLCYQLIYRMTYYRSSIIGYLIDYRLIQVSKHEKVMKQSFHSRLLDKTGYSQFGDLPYHIQRALME